MQYALLSVLAFSACFLTWVFYMHEMTFETDRVFITISTFLFSIFAGFFIARQARRYNKVRETVAAFDGKLTDIYRLTGHVNRDMQKQAGAIIEKHYRAILKSNKWDLHFADSHSSTLSSLHGLLDTYIGDEKVNNLKNQSIGTMLKDLSACQDFRKQMVALREEKMPLLQWVLLYFFVAMLFITVAAIPTAGLFFGSLLKAAFIISIIAVISILYMLNDLRFSESVMGEHSARDVLEILKGNR